MELEPREPPRPDASISMGEKGAPVSTEMGITVVVPTFNSAGHIEACLASVRRCLPDAEVIVVDNGSTDGTRETLRDVVPAVVVISGHGNLGFGRACNLGANEASRDYLLYLNPDAELVSIDTQLLTSAARNRPFGMLAAMLIEGDAPPRPTLRRQSGHWLKELVAVHLLAMLSQFAPRPRYVEQADERGIYTVGGAVFMVAVEEFRSLGGFDERFFMYYEDTDLTQRYQQLGYPLQSSSAILASHLGGASAPAPKRNALSFLGWLEYVEKWHGHAAAVRGATIARFVYSVLLTGLRVITGITGNARFRAKTEQVAMMLSHIATQGFDRSAAEPRVRYPAAAPIATHKFRSSAEAL